MTLNSSIEASRNQFSTSIAIHKLISKKKSEGFGQIKPWSCRIFRPHLLRPFELRLLSIEMV